MCNVKHEFRISICFFRNQGGHALLASALRRTKPHGLVMRSQPIHVRPKRVQQELAEPLHLELAHAVQLEELSL